MAGQSTAVLSGVEAIVEGAKSGCHSRVSSGLLFGFSRNFPAEEKALKFRQLLSTQTKGHFLNQVEC